MLSLLELKGMRCLLVLLCTVSVLKSSVHGLQQETATQLVFSTQSFEPSEWEHVSINSENLVSLAEELARSYSLKVADWREILPLQLEIPQLIDYVMGLICIDFCHWGLTYYGDGVLVSNFYVLDETGALLRGSAAMSFLAKQAYAKGVNIFDPLFMAKMTIEDVSPYFMGIDDDGRVMQIPWLQERVNVLNEVGQILLEKWQGSFYSILKQSQGRAFNQGMGFIDLLVRDFPRFRDEYLYKGKKVGIYKLAQLGVMALQSIFDFLETGLMFIDCTSLTLCADYQIPRSLRALGILEYGSALAEHIVQDREIAAGSAMEVEVRMAAIVAGHKLKEAVNQRLQQQGKPLITARELDCFLWSHGRTLGPYHGKHHLTRTTMY